MKKIKIKITKIQKESLKYEIKIGSRFN